VHDGVHPYLIGSNRVKNETAVGSPLDRLRDLDNAVDVVSRQTRSIRADNLDLRAPGKEQCAKESEMTH
jgi:hypothetical protein